MNQLFEIFKVGPQQAELISAAPDPPHIHNYEELIIGIQGKLEHFIDFKIIELKAPDRSSCRCMSNYRSGNAV